MWSQFETFVPLKQFTYVGVLASLRKMTTVECRLTRQGGSNLGILSILFVKKSRAKPPAVEVLAPTPRRATSNIRTGGSIVILHSMRFHTSGAAGCERNVWSWKKLSSFESVVFGSWERFLTAIARVNRGWKPLPRAINHNLKDIELNVLS